MTIDMLEQIILGAVQGIAEWLPISSEGLIVLIKNNFFNGGQGIEAVIKGALFLHLGTFLAALVYFRKDVWQLVKAIFNYKKQNQDIQKIFNFLLISFIISGILGYGLLKLLVGIENRLELAGKIINLIIGLLLLITAWLQIKAKKQGFKKEIDLKTGDSVLLGILQGLAVLPGLSRSGLTISGLLLKKYDEQAALRLSFLMSLPVVLIGNIVLNFKDFAFSWSMILGLVFAFVFGILTIGLLLRLAKKINFGYFVLIFGLLIITAVLV